MTWFYNINTSSASPTNSQVSNSSKPLILLSTTFLKQIFTWRAQSEPFPWPHFKEFHYNINLNSENKYITRKYHNQLFHKI